MVSFVLVGVLYGEVFVGWCVVCALCLDIYIIGYSSFSDRVGLPEIN